MINVTSEFLSLFYYIKDQTLPVESIEQEQNVSLSLDTSSGLYLATSIMEPNPIGRGRNWIYFDTVSGSSNVDINQEQVDRVTVYKTGGGTIDPSDYEVNYVLGGIDYIGIGETPISIDYYFNYVSLLDSWPGTEVPELPVISVDLVDTDKAGYQLGHGKKQIRPVRVDIFASSSREQKELNEVVYDGLYLRSILPYDFSTGEPLGYDGKFNPEWGSTVSGTLSNYNRMEFHNVKARRVNMPVSYSDINRYRSVVTFDLVSYVE